MMKKLKLWIFAFLVGEFLTLWYRDKKFQKKVKQESGLNKLKVIFQGLFDFNKEIVADAKEIDLKAKFMLLQEQAQDKLDLLQHKLSELELKWKELNADKIKPLLAEIEEHYLEVKANIADLGEEMVEKYQLDKQLAKIKSKLSKLKKRKL